jgi:hypothetical protein
VRVVRALVIKMPVSNFAVGGYDSEKRTTDRATP